MAFRLAPLARDRGSNVIFGLALFVVESTPIRGAADSRWRTPVPAPPHLARFLHKGGIPPTFRHQGQISLGPSTFRAIHLSFDPSSPLLLKLSS